MSTSDSHLAAATQAAVDATASAYADDASIDVGRRLRAELVGAGLDIDDDAWIAEVAEAVRSGHPLVFGEEPEPRAPGSLGGDNGGA